MLRLTQYILGQFDEYIQLTDPNTKANDYARPGHIFPLIAKDGGVLRRAGHTEAEAHGKRRSRTCRRRRKPIS